MARPGHANGAPRGGAAAVSTSAWLPCVHLIKLSDRPFVAWLDTPPAAGRAWVPGCRARTFYQSVGPFYDESRSQGSPGRDQFVISISGHVYIPLTGASSRHAGPAAGASAAVQKIFASAQHYDGTSVHDQAIYVVIRLHGFLVAIRWLCGVAFADKLPYRTEPAHPPRAGPCAAPALPPGGGRPPSLLNWPSASFRRGSQYLPGGRPPGAPQSWGDAPPTPPGCRGLHAAAL